MSEPTKGLTMSATAPHQTLTEEVAAFLATGPSPKAIARYRISAHAQRRLRALMEKHLAGMLSPAESAELDEITVLDQLFTLIRARLLASPHAPDRDPEQDGADR
ncbi:MAG TPA: hypothetical protein VGR57_20600 [Ktedonobacterales bacterium]|nr:hypothetical protein [Ktedonobacterales bacterium]